MNRTVLTYIIGSLIVAALIFGARQISNPTHVYTRTITSDVIQGILVGIGLAFVTLLIIGNAYVTKVNGWTTMFGCGESGTDILRRAACNVIFLGPINAPQEAMYWTTSKDGAGRALNGQHDYIMRFPSGGLPPNNAFWSLTMGDAKSRFVANPINRYSVGDRSGLVPTPTVPLTSIFRTPLRQATNPTGCLRPPAISSSGCGRICPVKPFLTANTKCRRSSKHNEAAHESAFAYLRFGDARGMGARHTPARLLLAAPREQFVQKSDPQSRLRRGPVPINTLYTESQSLFAEPLTAQSASGSNLATTGVNHDTLLTLGWLDLSTEPQVLHVPDFSGRYYSVQFTDPFNVNFAYVGTRTTGTQAGDYLITGPDWKGQAPGGMTQISSPNNSVLVIGRVLVYSDNDLPAAYDLSKQIQLTPLSGWQPSQ